MKHILKSIFCLMLIFTMSFTLVGCSRNNGDTPNDTTNNQTGDTANNDTTLDDIDLKVKNKFTSDYVVNRDDVSEAVNYIHENINDIDDRTVAKKLYEHGSFLVMAAENGKVANDNEIRHLGTQAKEYAKKVYQANDNEVNDIVNEARGKFDEYKTNFGNDVNGTVDSFMEYFKTPNNR